MNYDPKRREPRLPRHVERDEEKRRQAQREHDAREAAFVGPPTPLKILLRGSKPGVIVIAGGSMLLDRLREKGFTSFMGKPIAPRSQPAADPADPAPPAPPLAAP